MSDVADRCPVQDSVDALDVLLRFLFLLGVNTVEQINIVKEGDDYCIRHTIGGCTCGKK